jgi:oxygen-independent coproporphyrinogen III oxidase
MPELSSLPSILGAPTPLAGIYVHIPFCLRKCLYCDFYSTVDLSLKPAFLEALISEIAAADPGALVFDTIYFGGGTPSLLSPPEVARILGALFARFHFQEPVEITLEANPGTVGLESLKGLRSAGVNRLNIGVQSFQDENLEQLGRIHSAAQAQDALAAARRAGFEELGLDLIYGLPGQRRPAWLADLRRALAHQPEHLSCYMLTLERGTALAERHRLGRFRPAPEARVAELFMVTSGFLEGQGYLHYEISNFARFRPAKCREARVSRHNSKYWSHASYLGFGPAAHSFLPPRRFWNHRDVTRYVEDLRTGRRPLAGEEILDRGQQLIEAILLGLRTAAGIDVMRFKRRFGVDFIEVFGAAAADLTSQGLLRLTAERCAATRRGMLFLDTVTAALAAATLG